MSLPSGSRSGNARAARRWPGGVFRFEGGDLLAVFRDRELAGPGEPAFTVEDGNLVLLHQEPDAFGEFVRDFAGALDDRGGVVGNVGGRQAEIAQVIQEMTDFRGPQQAFVGMQPQLRQIPPRCSRSTSAGLQTELGSADRRDIAATTAADDDQVEFSLGHRELSYNSMASGSSTSALKAPRKLAPTAPSTTR